MAKRNVALLVAILVCGGCEGESRIPTQYTPLPAAPSDPPLAAGQIVAAASLRQTLRIPSLARMLRRVTCATRIVAGRESNPTAR
jgi:hypothetical protein